MISWIPARALSHARASRRSSSSLPSSVKRAPAFGLTATGSRANLADTEIKAGMKHLPRAVSFPAVHEPVQPRAPLPPADAQGVRPLAQAVGARAEHQITACVVEPAEQNRPRPVEVFASPG